MVTSKNFDVTWRVPVSEKSKRTLYPSHNFSKISETKSEILKRSYLNLASCDSGNCGNLTPDPLILDEVLRSLSKKRYHNCGPSVGYLTTRKVVCNHVYPKKRKPKPHDIILTNGASSALDMAISVLANPGDNILIPNPSSPLYELLCASHDISYKCYELQPKTNWEVNLENLESLIDKKTKAIIVNNPSNPCGSVFSRRHIREIIEVAERNRLPIIADEAYANFVHRNTEFVWFSEEAVNVPILSCSGIGKRYMVPGWRLGWIALFDNKGILDDVRKGLFALSNISQGPNTVVQGALEQIIKRLQQAFVERVQVAIQKNADIAFKQLSKIKGLKPIMSKGSIFMMCLIDKKLFPRIENGIEFTRKLEKEEFLLVLPGENFRYPNSFRIVLATHAWQMTDACRRIKAFCCRHRNHCTKQESQETMCSLGVEDFMNDFSRVENAISGLYDKINICYNKPAIFGKNMENKCDVDISFNSKPQNTFQETLSTYGSNTVMSTIKVHTAAITKPLTVAQTDHLKIYHETATNSQIDPEELNDHGSGAIMQPFNDFRHVGSVFDASQGLSLNTENLCRRFDAHHTRDLQCLSSPGCHNESAKFDLDKKENVNLSSGGFSSPVAVTPVDTSNLVMNYDSLYLINVFKQTLRNTSIHINIGDDFLMYLLFIFFFNNANTKLHVMTSYNICNRRQLMLKDKENCTIIDHKASTNENVSKTLYNGRQDFTNFVHHILSRKYKTDRYLARTKDRCHVPLIRRCKRNLRFCFKRILRIFCLLHSFLVTMVFGLAVIIIGVLR